MSTKTKKSGKKSSGGSLFSGISPRTRNTILVGVGSAALIAGLVWAYYALTTIPPPPVDKVAAQEVTDYLGNPRGYGRLSVPRREEYLVGVYQQFNTPKGMEDLNRALRSMSMQERQVFVDATFDVARERVMVLAEEFNRTPPKDRQRFVDNAISNFRNLQGNLGGGGNPNMNVGEPFKPLAPEQSDGWNKVLFSKTSARDRAKAEPLIDAMAKGLREQKAQAARR